MNTTILSWQYPTLPAYFPHFVIFECKKFQFFLRKWYFVYPAQCTAVSKHPKFYRMQWKSLENKGILIKNSEGKLYLFHKSVLRDIKNNVSTFSSLCTF